MDIAMAETPPVAPVQVVADDYHGTTVADPYRYMEDFKSSAVQDWVKAQADFAHKTLRSLQSRDALLDRIVELDAGTPYSLFGIERLPSGDLFYFKQRAAENVADFLSGAPSGLAVDPGPGARSGAG